MTSTLTALVLISASAGFGQTALSFEAASVKPNVHGEVNGEGHPRSTIQASTASLTARNASLSECIQWAYNVSPWQVAGPSWMDAERLDIDAKAAGPVSKEQLRGMLQTLLAERFRLKFHRESKELPGYALVAAKGGPKMRESATEGEPVMKPNRTMMVAERMTMARFSEILAGPLHSPVADMTGLTGRYDFSIDIARYVTPASTPEEMIASLSLCLQEELGLKVEARKLPLEVLAIDHAEKTPVEN
jgi:uncharacterized protein (TIGR03435 family)